jgi:DNA-binding transcriptional regulator YiaG
MYKWGFMTAEQMKKNRKDLKLTREQLAHDLCVSKATIDSWESGRRVIPLSCEKLFCVLYNLPFVHPSIRLQAFDATPDLFADN